MSKTLLSLIEAELNRGGALEIKIFHLSSESALADHMIVASGTSTRHVASLAERLALEVKKEAKINASIEGLREADWVLVDGGDVIVHLFRPEVRAYYNIEELWETRPDKESDKVVRP
jgi:ribosome-associated protein